MSGGGRGGRLTDCQSAPGRVMCGVDLNSGFMVCFQECFRVALLATASYSSREYLAAAAPGSPKSPPILLSCERRKKRGRRSGLGCGRIATTPDRTRVVPYILSKTRICYIQVWKDGEAHKARWMGRQCECWAGGGKFANFASWAG